ncbi:PREDICTED: E3 ubiquitin-ligase rbrA [Prunus dulcis]|uniref:PREDICTED: E3 ubiquitin-ligase rbrA n=1 Tax=Prunus dulcis TaxID=3755 RepID=A0A5E4FCR8_PRUDU|nr:PREDICTED: E3 ubiquitin-ligase rbrA [Prunus dulcis]
MNFGQAEQQWKRVDTTSWTLHRTLQQQFVVLPRGGRFTTRGLLREETLDIWGWKVVVVGAGVAICDRRDNLIFESRKNLKSLNFAVRSRKTAELLALIDGLKEAFTLKLKRVTSTLPGSSEIAA